MSRRSEIIERAQAEFQAAIDRGRDVREQILRQQRDVLVTNSPAAKAALAAWETAQAEAFARYQQSVSGSEDALVAAEFEATAARDHAELAASEAWRDATARAETTRQADRQIAEEGFNDAFKDASKLTGAQRDQAVANARKRRDAALQTAERACQQEMDVAWRIYQKATTTARETAIAAFEHARGEQAAAAEKAAGTHDKERLKAERAFQKAIAADPTAAAVHEAFELRLANLEAETEREKRNILDRMRADLEHATP